MSSSSYLSIPDFTHDGVLPPHRGDPTTGSSMSPYFTDMESIINRFCTSSKRCAIMRGFINFRNAIYNCKILEGFLWINGSYTQHLSREPNDIDVIAFVNLPKMDPAIFMRLIEKNELHFGNTKFLKDKFHCDAYPVTMTYNDGSFSADYLIRESCFWFGLFSHTREKLWKGILRVNLQLDAEEPHHLSSLVDSIEATL